jgi:hypothetical protein
VISFIKNNGSKENICKYIIFWGAFYVKCLTVSQEVKGVLLFAII